MLSELVLTIRQNVRTIRFNSIYYVSSVHHYCSVSRRCATCVQPNSPVLHTDPIFSVQPSRFLQRVRIARNAERCTS